LDQLGKPPQPGRSPLLGGGPPPRKPVMALRDLMQDLQQDREDR